MKRLLLLFFSCLAFTVNAQTDFVEREAVFDFNNAGTLNPAVTNFKDAGETYILTNSVFKDDSGLFTVSFSKELSEKTQNPELSEETQNPERSKEIQNPVLKKAGSDFNSESYLCLYKGNHLHLDAKLLEDNRIIEILEVSVKKTSDAGLESKIGGVSTTLFDFNTEDLKWTAKKSCIGHVDFYNDGDDASLNSLVIRYRIIRQAVIDFNHPLNLYPKVTDIVGKREKYSLEIHNVIDERFTDEHGLFNITFSKVKASGAENASNDPLLVNARSLPADSVYLWLFRGDSLHISVKNPDANNSLEIAEVYFQKTSDAKVKCNTGGLICSDKMSQWFEHDPLELKWSAKKTGLKQIDFLNTGQDAILNSMYVVYRTQMDVLYPATVDPTNESKINSFEKYEINFHEPVRLANNVTFKLTGEETEYALTSSLSEDGKTVTLTPALEVAPGTYTLVCPEKTFYSASDDFYNPEYTYTFTLVEPLKLVSTNPAVGKVPGDKLPATIELTFNKLIGSVSDAKNVITLSEEDGTSELNASADFVKGTKKVNVKLPFEILESGVYYLDIPEGFIHDALIETDKDNSTYNKALHLQFIVGDIVRPSVEKVEEAKAVLEISGVGTPKVDAAERLALAEMIAKNRCSDDQLAAAIAAFYNSTDIEMPKKGGYYTITNVAKNGTKRYLAYKDGAVTLTSDEAKAYSFLADSLENGKTTFRTFDKKYLHMLVNSNRYGATTTKNVTDAYTSEVNDLQLAVFDAEGIERKDRIGYMTIYGAVGKTSEADDMIYIYALVDTTTPDGTFDLAMDGKIYFNTNVSSVFTFAEAEAPQPEAVKYEVSPAANTILDENGDIFISFLGSEKIDADTDNLKAVLKKKDSDKEYTLTCKMTHDDGKSKAQLHFTRIEDGEYSLVIPKGFFYHLGDEAQKYDLNEITVDYKVKSSDVFITDYIKEGEVRIAIFNNDYGTFLVNIDGINNLSFCLRKNTNLLNSLDPAVTTNKVKLNALPYDKEVTRGTFAKRDSEDYIPEVSIYEGDEWIGYVKGEIDLESTTPYRYYLKGNYQHTREAKYPYITYPMGNQYTAVRENDVVVTHLLDVKFDKVLTADDVPDGYYELVIDKGTIGDEYFGRYMEGDSSVKKSDCHVNDIQRIMIQVDASLPTGVEPVQILPAARPSVYDLSGRRVSDSSRPGLYIKNGKKVFVK